jgi:hypothetical protein
MLCRRLKRCGGVGECLLAKPEASDFASGCQLPTKRFSGTFLFFPINTKFSRKRLPVGDIKLLSRPPLVLYSLESCACGAFTDGATEDIRLRSEIRLVWSAW